MLNEGTRIRMTKGYRGLRGGIREKTDSPFEFYVVKLVNGIHVVVGPSGFVVEQENDSLQA